MIHQSGVSLIEVLIVVAIICVVGASTTPFLSNFLLRNNTEVSIDKIIGTLRKAQQYSLDGKSDASWGSCYISNTVRLFRGGTCAAPTFSEDFSIPSTVSITGFSPVTFSTLRGEPSTALSITVSTAIDSKTIQVNNAGGMTIN